MKRFTILAMFIAVTLGSFAQEVLQMHVWKNGDSRDYIVSTEIDSITFTKEIIYSPFYAWDVEGGVDWSVYDENPNAEPLEAYTGSVRTLVDKIKDNMSDEELSSIGLIKYEGDPYPNPTKLTNFAVFVTSNTNPSLSDILGVNTLINYGDKEYYIVKRIKRNNTDYNIYIYPDELNKPIERKNLIL